MISLLSLVVRNCKLFFKDKGMFISSLISPAILLVLYASFLAKVYRESFASALPDGFIIDTKLLEGTVGAQLITSILAVSCVTVAFCSNLLMVDDKITGAKRDLLITPVKRGTLALGYFIASAIATMIVGLTALSLCLVYLATAGWYLTAVDVLLLVLDVIELTLFGTAISSIVNFPLKTNGQGSAVGTIVSAGYGFICGAYMPLSNFGEGLQRVLSFFPGTYGTSLLRNRALRGVYDEMSSIGFPSEAIEAIKDSIDCNLYFFGNKVEIWTMELILIASIAILVSIYVAMNVLSLRNKKH